MKNYFFIAVLTIMLMSCENTETKSSDSIIGKWQSTADKRIIIEKFEAKKDESPGKYLAMFERRAKKGQCFNQPYLGCREFSANFEFIEDTTQYQNGYSPIQETYTLGFILYDLDFSDPNNFRPAFYRAQLNNGIIYVPPWDSEEVRK